jgi:hypothetical protein
MPGDIMQLYRIVCAAERALAEKWQEAARAVCVEREKQRETPENKPSSATAKAPPASGASTCSCLATGARGEGESKGRACRGRRKERSGEKRGAEKREERATTRKTGIAKGSRRRGRTCGGSEM